MNTKKLNLFIFILIPIVSAVWVKYIECSPSFSMMVVSMLLGLYVGATLFSIRNAKKLESSKQVKKTEFFWIVPLLITILFREQLFEFIFDDDDLYPDFNIKTFSIKILAVCIGMILGIVMKKVEMQIDNKTLGIE